MNKAFGSFVCIAVLIAVLFAGLWQIKPVHAAITRVQGNARGTAASANTIAVTMTDVPTSGNTLIAIVRVWFNYIDTRVTSIVETGVIWTFVMNSSAHGDGYCETEIWFGLIGSGASKDITVNLQYAADYSGADVCEYTPALALDKTAYNSGNSASPDTGTTATTSDASEVWVGGTGLEYYTQDTPTNGFTLLDGATGMGTSLAYLEKIVSSTGTANSGTTGSGSYVWSGCIATFKEIPADTTSPTYSSVSVSNTVANIPVKFKATFADNVALGQYSFSTNTTGAWVYDAPVSFTGNPQTISVWKTLNSTIGTVVGYEWNLTDWIGNTNDTGILTLTTRGWVLPTWDSATEATANYIIFHNTTSTYINRTSDNTIVFSSTNIPLVFDTAFGYGGNITVKPATYVATDTIYMDNSNINLTFELGALLQATTNLNKPIFELWYGSNNTILGIQIDGNSANQNGDPAALLICGVSVYDGINNHFTGANITNCKRDGFDLFDDTGSLVINSGINDSLITFCGWNGVTFGSSTGAGYDTKMYCINNEIAYCSDVGVSTYATGSIIRDNYIHDMNGTTNTQAHWAIGVEDNGYNTIMNNTLVKDGTGVESSYGPPYYHIRSNLIKGNYIDCVIGIAVVDDGYNVITQNTIVNYSSGYAFGITSYWGKNNIISFNTIEGSPVSNDQALYVYNSSDISILNNTITSPNIAIELQHYCSNAIIKTNVLQGITGITISDSTCENNTLVNNAYTCTADVSDSGTGTRNNPASSDNYMLTLNNPYYASTITPVAGRYSYSNTSTVLVTLMPETAYSSVLNVDGSNVTLTSNAYNVTMGVDRTIYAMFVGPNPTNVVVSILFPTNTTYSDPSGNIPVVFTASGGTIDKRWYNCKNGTSWVYPTNLTFTTATSMNGFARGTSYIFYGWANNTLGVEGEATVMFSVEITVFDWGSYWGDWWGYP